MKFSKFSTLTSISGFLCWVLALAGQSSSVVDQLNETRTLLEEWVRTETVISEEAAQWQVEKRVLEDIAEVAERELQLLEEGIAKIRENQTDGEQAKDALLQRRRELDELVQRLESYLPRLEQQLLQHMKSFPQPLQDIVALQASRIPSASTAPEKLPSFVFRAQNIAVILRQADLFNSRITLDKPRLQIPDLPDKVYNVLYFGLGAAYFVDESGKVAGFGGPGTDGWVWTRQDSIASRVWDGILIFENKVPAKFLQLPVQIKPQNTSLR